MDIMDIAKYIEDHATEEEKEFLGMLRISGHKLVFDSFVSRDHIVIECENCGSGFYCPDCYGEGIEEDMKTMYRRWSAMKCGDTDGEYSR